MLVDNLYHEEEKYLPLEEAIYRIAWGFRRVSFDFFRGDAIVRTRHQRLVEVDAPLPLLDKTLSFLGATAWVSVSDTEQSDAGIEFVLQPDCEVFITYASEAERTSKRPLVEKLATVLGYKVAGLPIFLGVEIQLRAGFSIATELNIHQQLGNAIGDLKIGHLDACRFDGDKLKLTVVVEDEERAREQLSGVLDDMFPNAEVTMTVPPDEWPWTPR